MASVNSSRSFSLSKLIESNSLSATETKPSSLTTVNVSTKPSRVWRFSTLKIEPLSFLSLTWISTVSPRYFCKVCASVIAGPKLSAATSWLSGAGLYSTERTTPPLLSSKTRLFKTSSTSCSLNRMLTRRLPSTVPSWKTWDKPELNIMIRVTGGGSTTLYSPVSSSTLGLSSLEFAAVGAFSSCPQAHEVRLPNRKPISKNLPRELVWMRLSRKPRTESNPRIETGTNRINDLQVVCPFDSRFENTPEAVLVSKMGLGNLYSQRRKSMLGSRGSLIKK